MATIITRPSSLSAIGGVFPNPISYQLASTLDREVVQLRDEQGVVIVSNVYSFVFSSKAVFDFSGLLASFVEAVISYKNQDFVDVNFSKIFYVTGDNFTEILNKRVALASKLDALSGDLEAYKAGNFSAKFMTVFDTLPQFKDCFLAIYKQDNSVAYLREIEYDQNNLILSDMTRLIKMTSGLLRFLIAFSILSACQKKTVEVLVAPTQLLTNCHFENGLSGWNQTGGQNLFTALAPTYVVMSDNGGGSGTVLRQLVTFTGDIHLWSIKYKSATPISVIISGADSVPIPFVLPASNDYTIKEVYLDCGAGTRNLENFFYYGNIDGVNIQIDYISLTLMPTNASEVKTLERQDLCGITSFITWLSPIGGWEHYGFTNTVIGAKSVGSAYEFMPYGSRHEIVTQAKQRDTIQVRTLVPIEHLAGLSTILSSPQVYWCKSETELIYIKLTSNNLPLSNDTEGLFEVVLDFDLPYHNS
jgi:hypothetical protein